MIHKKALLPALKILFTLLLLLLVFRSVDVSEIADALAAVHVPYLLMLLAALWAGQVLCSERWRLFAASLGMHGSLWDFIKIYFAGMFFNVGLPTLIGGDVIKAFILSRKCGKPFGVGLATVIQDRAAGLFFLLLYGSVAIVLVPLAWRGVPLWTVYLLLWIAVGAVLWLLKRSARMSSVPVKAEHESFARKLLRSLAEFHRALGTGSMKKGMFFRISLYSLINSAVALWIFQQVTVAAGHYVGILHFAALFPIMTLVTMLPITLGGIGVREWVYIEALSLVGIPREAGLVISLATSALIILCNLGGAVFLPAVPAELRQPLADRS